MEFTAASRYPPEALGIELAAVAQLHDQNVGLGALSSDPNADLALVDLGLLARPGLEAALRECRDAGGRAQRGRTACFTVS